MKMLGWFESDIARWRLLEKLLLREGSRTIESSRSETWI